METSTEATVGKKKSTNLWSAFITEKGTARVLTAKYQKDLKKQLNAAPEAEVLSIVRGRLFETAVVKSFDIVSREDQIQ